MDIDPDEEYHVLRFATYDMLVGHDNEAFLEAQGKIQSQQEELSQLKVKLQYLQELYDKSLTRLHRSGSSRGAGQSGACEKTAFSAYPPLQNTRTKLPQLDQPEYPDVNFWTRELWDKHCAYNKGKTNGLAQTAGKRGRPAKRTSDEVEDNEEVTKHPYIETVEGRPVSGLHLHRIGVKARSIWTSLANRGLAPEKFKKMDSAAKEYYFTEMCNEFFELRLCSDFWKLELWSSKNYPSWSQNHLEEKKETSKRRKLEKEARATQIAQTIAPPQPPTPQPEPSQPPPAPAPPFEPSQAQPPPPQPPSQPPRSTTPPLPNRAMRLTFETNCDNPEFFDDLDQQAATSSNAIQTAIQNSLGMQQEENEGDHDSSNSSRLGVGKEKPRALAVVGAGTTPKNFCMSDWLEKNPGGYKDDFEEYYKGLTAEQLQPFSAAAKDALNARARERQKTKQKK
ncbi:hypothetical protein M378DRAFT_18535 [Amanita muscaria Koide BX008]|uniref:Uncharacterized protein n=1 Tax=Amanita muscaria (strain Koide BX008) TaxID=946122 RepID=A0A0C2WDY1_AMAMK|nr:hypothetical protein M378DRAFT_18535 [Amanita muscaria Koide BX008]